MTWLGCQTVLGSRPDFPLWRLPTECAGSAHTNWLGMPPTASPIVCFAGAAADGVGTYPFPRAPVRGELKMPKSSPSAASRLVSLFSFGARRGDRAAVTRATEPGPEKMDDSRMVARRRAGLRRVQALRGGFSGSGGRGVAAALLRAGRGHKPVLLFPRRASR